MYITGKRGTAQYDQSSYVATVGYNGSGESDAAAIAAAPTDIAALLQEVERLNRMVDKSVEMLHAEIDCPLDKNGIRKYLESEVTK